MSLDPVVRRAYERHIAERIEDDGMFHPKPRLRSKTCWTCEAIKTLPISEQIALVMAAKE